MRVTRDERITLAVMALAATWNGSLVDHHPCSVWTGIVHYLWGSVGPWSAFLGVLSIFAGAGLAALSTIALAVDPKKELRSGVRVLAIVVFAAVAVAWWCGWLWLSG